MIVGLPKEVKDNEYRVGLVPAGVKTLTDAGHAVVIESGAGEGSGITDHEYERAGGEL
ncbi:MAG TPA: alanine dehydrogenase, partial [Blastocatellia bacterium]|nr:alanine dehydrogenase [Blastocatellia bacterium]